jgi:hypothetical protein
VREQDGALEREHSNNGFHKQVNLVERTRNDDLRAMSCNVGIAIIVRQSKVPRTALANGMSANAGVHAQRYTVPLVYLFSARSLAYSRDHYRPINSCRD